MVICARWLAVMVISAYCCAPLIAGAATDAPRRISDGQPAIHAPEPAGRVLSTFGLGIAGYYIGWRRMRNRSEAASSIKAFDKSSYLAPQAARSLLGIINERLYLVSKRFADLLLATAAILILSPVLLIIAAAIYFESPGPVLYAHRRLGQRKRKFKLFKFRSMCLNADEVLADLLAFDAALREEFEENYKLKNDPRITRVGAFLRRTSLDELPQLINVLRGEMSVVGPRPIVEGEVDKYWPSEARLFSIRPGVTGLWQVSGRNDTSYEDRVRLDMRYLFERSVLGDALILLLTIPALLRRKGAY